MIYYLLSNTWFTEKRDGCIVVFETFTLKYMYVCVYVCITYKFALSCVYKIIIYMIIILYYKLLYYNYYIILGVNPLYFI